eukprot:gene9842-25145_t
MQLIAGIVGGIFAAVSLAVFAVVASKFSKAPAERKARIKAILVADEAGAIKAFNWRHPILVGSKLVAVVCLLLSWIFVTANKIGFGKMSTMFVVPLNFGCMLTNVWYLHKYAAGGGFDGHDWRREFVACCVATGLQFVSCCMISSVGSSFGMISRFGKVPGLAMLKAGAAFSWFGLIAMLVSLFGAWTKRQNPDVDGSTNGTESLTAYQPSEVPALAALPHGHEQQQQPQQYVQQQGYPPQAQSNSAAPAAAASAAPVTDAETVASWATAAVLTPTQLAIVATAAVQSTCPGVVAAITMVLPLKKTDAAAFEATVDAILGQTAPAAPAGGGGEHGAVGNASQLACSEL